MPLDRPPVKSAVALPMPMTSSPSNLPEWHPRQFWFTTSAPSLVVKAFSVCGSVALRPSRPATPTTPPDPSDVRSPGPSALSMSLSGMPQLMYEPFNRICSPRSGSPISCGSAGSFTPEVHGSAPPLLGGASSEPEQPSDAIANPATHDQLVRVEPSAHR